VSLTACHKQVDISQNFRIEQCTVQRSITIIYSIALTKRVQTIALSRMFSPGELQTVGNAAVVTQWLCRGVCQPEF
jgi:hypothetical protein